MDAHRRTDPFEFLRVEGDSFIVQILLNDQPADPVADGQAIRRRSIVDVIRRDQAARPGHVFNTNGRIAGNMFHNMARDRPRVGIEPAAGREADDDTDGFACKKPILSDARKSEEKSSHRKSRPLEPSARCSLRDRQRFPEKKRHDTYQRFHQPTRSLATGSMN